MSARLSGAPAQTAGAEILAVPVFSGPAEPRLGPIGAPGADGLGNAVGAGLRRLRHFQGQAGQLAVVPVEATAGLVVAIGVGERGECTVDRLRAVSIGLGRYLRRYGSVATSLALVGSGDAGAATRTVLEGFCWGRYSYREAPDPTDVELVLLTESEQAAGSDSLQRALTVAMNASMAVAWVRTLVEAPPSTLPPAVFADRIREHATSAGVRCRVRSGAELEQAGFGGTLGVGSGSVNPPVVVELTYAGDGVSPRWGLAGKGITFDAGGINLKRDPGEISWMKSDMAGAASVVAAVCAAARSGAGRPVHAVLPLAENLPGSGALLPGDVVRHPDGSSTEVLDTDSEGRLVLADAVSYLAAQQVAAIIDVGTLTDGGGVGHLLWGCWGTAGELIDELVAAGARVGDPGWRLPLRDEYRALFDSPVADRTNQARDVPDTGTMAATFLGAFPGAVPWLHIDNGGTAYLDADLPPFGPGATGSPTPALLELLCADCPPDRGAGPAAGPGGAARSHAV